MSAESDQHVPNYDHLALHAYEDRPHTAAYEPMSVETQRGREAVAPQLQVALRHYSSISQRPCRRSSASRRRGKPDSRFPVHTTAEARNRTGVRIAHEALGSAVRQRRPREDEEPHQQQDLGDPNVDHDDPLKHRDPLKPVHLGSPVLVAVTP